MLVWSARSSCKCEDGEESDIVIIGLQAMGCTAGAFVAMSIKYRIFCGGPPQVAPVEMELFESAVRVKRR